MMEYLGSMFIDNELDLDEKVHFIEKIHCEQDFFQETVELLEQEKLLRMHPEKLKQPNKTPIRRDVRHWLGDFLRPVVYAGAGFALATLLLFTRTMVSTAPSTAYNRFVIYEPTASQVEITGTFNGWQREAMKPVGTSGYWELNLYLPTGEYRFAYILDGAKRIADPTQAAREKDDFGGENSILKVAKHV